MSNKRIITLLGFVLLAGCASKDYYLVTSTGTVLGLELSQNQGTQTPQAKLGYNRAELALVPTNRSVCGTGDDGSERCTEVKGSHNGAADTAEVMMELRYGGFSFTGGGGIYQRLAIGREAVTQPGAAFMFARKADGSLDEETALSVSSALKTITPADVEASAEIAPIRHAYNRLDDAGRDKINAAIRNAGFADYRDFVLHARADKVKKVREELDKDAEISEKMREFEAAMNRAEGD